MENNTLEFLEKFLKHYQDFKIEYQERNKKDSLEFNIFNLINEIYGIGETRHSKFLAFLLNPEADHGKETLFLDLFLKIVLGISVEPKLDWKVYAEKDNVDILLNCKSIDSTIIIENKSNWAEDQSNQLYRYWYNNIYLKKRNTDELLGKNDRIIYLAPNENKQYELKTLDRPDEKPYKSCELEKLEEKHVTNIYFNLEIKKWLKECIEHLENTPRIKYFVQDYLNFWEETNNKQQYFMKEIENYFEEKENDWININEIPNYLNELKNVWVEHFKEELKELKNDWNFYYGFDKEQYFTTLKYNDFRWYLKNKENLCFVYEYNKGLTIWKGNFFEEKSKFISDFVNVFGEDFIFLPDDSNYVMILKDEKGNDKIKFDENDADSKIAWNLKFKENEMITVIKNVLSKYLNDEKVKVKELFNKIDKDIN